MICYRDKTFCEDKNCKHFGNGCKDALTEEIKQKAYKWWGSEEAPISIYVDKLDCFEEK